MRSKNPRLHPLLILLAVALVSVLFVVSCGGGATATAVPRVADDAADTAAEAAAAEAAAAEAAAVQAAAAGLAAAKAGTPKYGGSLTMAAKANQATLDPAFLITFPDIAIHQAAYDNLLMIQADLSLKPELATSWEANDDLSSYTFQLREGVKFHHGKDFKAEDVVFTFTRLKDPVLDSPARTIFASIDEMVILDDYTIRFDLTSPNLFFPESLSIYFARIIPADVDEDRLALEEFGTGPFIITEHLPVERTTMERNPDYWEEGRPYLDEYIIQFIPEVATRSEALKSGDVDLIMQMNPQSIPGIEAHPDTLVLSSPSLTNIGMDMDTTVPPFDSKLVRKAIQAATDRESILQAATLGLGVIAYDNPVWPSDPRHSTDHRSPDYDIELAKSLLTEAGYPDGIDITLHTADVGPGTIEMAVAFKQSAEPAGIRVRVDRGPADNYWEVVWNTVPFSVVYWSGELVDQLMELQYHSDSVWNAMNYSNPTYDALLVEARGQDLEGQKETYAEMQRILIDDVPKLTVAFQPMIYGSRNNVRDMVPHPYGWPILSDVWLDD